MAQWGNSLRILGAGVALCSAANAQIDPGMVWRHQSTPTEAWAARSVSIGMHETVVFSQFEGFGQSARLISTFAPDPAPAEFDIDGPYYAGRVQSDSASEADVHASWFVRRNFASDSLRPTVCKYTNTSTQADWEWTFPFTVANGHGGVHVTGDGGTVVSWAYDPVASLVAIAIFRDESGVPADYETWSILGTARNSAMSDDGSRFCINGGNKTGVFDVATGDLIWQTSAGSMTGEALAISADGSMLARGLIFSQVQVYSQQGAGYVQSFTDSLTGAACKVLDFDDEASRVFMAYNYPANQKTTVLRVRDVAGAGTWSQTIAAQGAYSFGTHDLDASRDGQCFAVALSGDEANTIPELQVFTANGTGFQVTFSQDLPGTAFDVELTGDGRSVAVASKSTHENVIANGGQVDLFDVAPRDLRVQGVPRVGSAVVLEQHVGSGRHAITLASSKRARDPLAVGNVGTLYLDRNALSSVGNGTAGPDGIVERVIDIPNNAALIGSKVFYQTLKTGPRQLSEDWVCVSILP